MNTRVGTHLLLNLYEVDEGLLKDLQVGKPILDRAVKELNLTVVNEAGFQFQPFGYTYAYVLSESHFTIHTYPEHNSCYIDIFCCSSLFDANEAIRIMKTLFHTDTHTQYIITR